jgi:hypothetical protein
MEEFQKTIINDINALGQQCAVPGIKPEEGQDPQHLISHILKIKKAISVEKLALEQKLKKAECSPQRLWELLDNKNAETEVLDQRLAQAEKEQSRLRDLLAKETSDAAQLVKANGSLENEQKSWQALEATNKKLVQENELLLLQLHQAQEELEILFIKQQQRSGVESSEVLPTQSPTNQVMDEILNNSFDDYGNSTKELRDEIIALRQSWSWRVTTPCRLMISGMHGGKKTSNSLKGKSPQQLRDEIDALRKSWSWRVTAPLRWLASGATGRK